MELYRWSSRRRSGAAMWLFLMVATSQAKTLRGGGTVGKRSRMCLPVLPQELLMLGLAYLDQRTEPDQLALRETLAQNLLRCK